MKRLFFAIVVLAFAGGVYAQPKEQSQGWKVDNNHTSITFTVPHMMISEVTGNFKDFTINVKSTKPDFTDMSVDASIKVASISTDNEMRDNHLKSDDFFNAAKYPNITFKSTAVEKTGKNTYKIIGDLTIRDVTKKVTFDAVYKGSIKSMNGGTITAWTVTAVINRFDFGLKWNKLIESGGMVVGDQVSISMNVEMDK